MYQYHDWGKPERAPPLRDCWWHFCIIMVIPYYVLILKTFGICKTSGHTLSHRPMPPSLSLALSTWILAARTPLRRKGKVSLMMKRNNREKRDRETAEERDCRKFSTCRRRDAVHQQQGQLKPESAYTVDFSCVWIRNIQCEYWFY